MFRNAKVVPASGREPDESHVPNIIETVHEMEDETTRDGKVDAAHAKQEVKTEQCSAFYDTRGLACAKACGMGVEAAWTDEECTVFEVRCPPGTMQRRAYLLGPAEDGGGTLDQGASRPPRNRRRTYEPPTKADGSAFDGDSRSQWFANAIDEAGLPDDILMHGLRKTAACMLADGLCNTHEIASITGHKSLKEIERYTREANQRMLGAAISEAGTEREKNVE
jgi:hypothetical protein